MGTAKMHDDELAIDAGLVHQLLSSQFPEWADLPIAPVESAGTDNAIYRLGDELSVRLPRVDGAVVRVDKELRWLPKLAPRLPLPVPTPLAAGQPDDGYPFPWSVCDWLPGQNPTPDGLVDPIDDARRLAEFVRAMREIDPTDGPPSHRHGSLVDHERGARNSLAELAKLVDTEGIAGGVDVEAATAVWESAVRVPAWEAAPVWVHGDLLPGNLLTVDGRLGAVIDFGCVGVGDPACDLLTAWSLFSYDARAAFRTALSIDDAAWERGRGWALVVGLNALPYYRDTNPVFAGVARRIIDQVLADQ